MTGALNPRTTNRLTLPLLMLTATFSIPHVSSVAPFLTEISDSFDVSEGLAGQLGSANFIGAFLVAIGLSAYVVRLPLRPVLSVALIVIMLGSILTATAPWFVVVLLSRIVAGLGTGMLIGGVISAIGRAWPDPGQRVRRQGLVVAAFAGGPGIWAPIERLIADEWNWQGALLVYAMASGTVGVALWFALPALPGTSGPSETMRQRVGAAIRTLRLPVIGPLLVTRAFFFGTVGALFGFIAGFSDHFYSDSAAWIGPMIASLSVGFMVTSVFSATMIRWLGGPPRAAVLSLTAAAAFVSVMLWITPSPIFTTIMLFGYGAAAGVTMNASLALIYRFAGERQSSAIFIDGAVGPLGSLVAVVLAGVAFDAADDLSVYRAFVTFIGIAVVPIILIVARIAARQSAPAPS